MKPQRLRIYLFGEPRLELGGEPYTLKAPPKALPLLAYLLLQRRSPVPREKIASALWPDADQATAYSNVRRHLYYLLKALPPSDDETPWLLATQKSIGWNVASPYWLDVQVFETELHERGLRGRAVRLYSGDLYERCSDEWIDFERERLRTLQLSALAQLCADARERSAYVEALQYAQLMLAADSWREDALRAIMEIRMLLGDRAGAVAEYDRFRSRLRGELQTDPLAETVDLYERIRHSAGTRTQVGSQSRPAVTLIGRQSEVAMLRDEWQRAARGEGRAVFIGGEAGIGKTTLVQALREAVEESGGTILTGGATAHEETAYAAFAGIAHELGADIFTPATGEAERLRRFEAFADLLARKARAAPVLLIVEDLHWAGGATFDLLRYAILRLSKARVLFVGTYREFHVGRAHPLRAVRRQLAATRRCTNLALSTLDRQAVHALASHCAGRTLSDTLLSRVYERSDGNPLFVVELVRELRDGGVDTVPDSITAIVRERLARLNREARSLLQTAAIAGPSPSVELLVQVTGMREADVLLQLDELVTAHFLRQTGQDELSFAHEIIREAVYEGAREDTARSIHARVGLALRALHRDRFEEIASNAAWHFERAGMADAAADAYSIAGQHALSLYAIDEALTCAGKAYTGASSAQQRFDALKILEFGADARADRQAREAYVIEMLALSEQLDHASQAEALIRAVDFSSGGTAAEQQAALERLELFVADAPQYDGAYLLRRGEYLSRLGKPAAARDALQRAIDYFAAENDVESLLRGLAAFYPVALMAGDPLERLQERVQELRDRLPDADARVAARFAFLHCGALLDRDPVQAYQAAEGMLEYARHADDVWLQGLAHRSLGASSARRMLLGEAQCHLKRSAEIAIMAGRLHDLVRVRNWQVMVENRCANFALANTYGSDGLQIARVIGANNEFVSLLSNLSNTAVWSGDLETAERNVRESLRLGEALGYPQPSVQSLLGEILIASGRVDEGSALIEQARRSSSPQADALGMHRVHYPLLLGLVYLSMGRENDARRCAEDLRTQQSACASYYIHPQAYLWAAAQLLRLLGFAEDAAAFARAAQQRHAEIRAGIDDASSRACFDAFIFNRLIEEDAEPSDPLHAWYAPHLAREAAATAL